MVESTRERVPVHTDDEVNRRISRTTAVTVQYYAQHKGEIADRLKELDDEWDIERAIEANAAALAFVGVALSVLRGRRWLLLPIAVTGFLYQHAIQGWCPPVPALRRLGFRTTYEIEERRALKGLRGDFERATGSGAEALQAARA